MKNIYSRIFLLSLLFILQLYFPVRISAQCLCTGGLPATPITQTVTIAPIASSNIVFTFNKFDPTIGTLSCITFVNTVSGTSYSGARNTNKGNYHVGATEYIDSTNYLFSLSLLSKVTGPGVSVSRPFNTVYGYDKLKSMDTILNVQGDTITYGPTNFVTPPTTTVNLSGNAAYIGIGTVDFNFGVNGGMITLDGGANYKSSVTSIIGGTLQLTYYWCPAALLASGLQNFSAYKKDNNIFLKWVAENAADIDKYDIEYSTDGISFTPVADLQGNHSGAATVYNYTYALNGNSNGYVYFRVKQTGNSGGTTYSAVQKISLTGKGTVGLAILPNPASSELRVTFDQPVTGDYSVDLVNMAGQVVVNKKAKLAGANFIPVTWTSKPAPGVYFTRIVNTGNQEQQVVRVVIQ